MELFLILSCLVTGILFIGGIVLSQTVIETTNYCDKAGQSISKMYFGFNGTAFTISLLCTVIYLCAKKIYALDKYKDFFDSNKLKKFDTLVFIVIGFDIIVMGVWVLGLTVWLAGPSECDPFVNMHMIDPLNWWFYVMVHGIVVCIATGSACLGFFVFLLYKSTRARRYRGNDYDAY